MHPSTFEYLKPTDEQMQAMDKVRFASTVYAAIIEQSLPDGPDKTYVLRKLREVAMWVNVAITREANGAPRQDGATPD